MKIVTSSLIALLSLASLAALVRAEVIEIDDDPSYDQKEPAAFAYSHMGVDLASIAAADMGVIRASQQIRAASMNSESTTTSSTTDDGTETMNRPPIVSLEDSVSCSSDCIESEAHGDYEHIESCVYNCLQDLAADKLQTRATEAARLASKDPIAQAPVQAPVQAPIQKAPAPAQASAPAPFQEAPAQAPVLAPTPVKEPTQAPVTEPEVKTTEQAPVTEPEVKTTEQAPADPNGDASVDNPEDKPDDDDDQTDDQPDKDADPKTGGATETDDEDDEEDDDQDDGAVGSESKQ